MTHIPSYIQALAFSVLFLVFINGSIGWALVYVLAGVGLLSALTCAFSRKHFTVELKPRAEFAEFGDRLYYDVVVSSGTDLAAVPSQGGCHGGLQSGAERLEHSRRVSGDGKGFLEHCPFSRSAFRNGDYSRDPAPDRVFGPRDNNEKSALGGRGG